MKDKSEINRIATEQHANRYTKRLDAYTHLVIMLYAVLNNFNSLREVVSGFVTTVTRLRHFGLNYIVRRSTLSDANKRRSSEFFASVYGALWERYKVFLSDSRPEDAQGKKVYIMDSTTISLFTDVLKCSGRKPKKGKEKGGIKAHTIIRADADTPAFIRLTEATVHDKKVMGLAEKTLYKRMKGNFSIKILPWRQCQRDRNPSLGYDDCLAVADGNKERCNEEKMEFLRHGDRSENTH